MSGHGVLLVYTVYSVLYSEMALSRKPFEIGRMYIYNFFLRMTDAVAFQNIDLSSWDILYTEIQKSVALVRKRTIPTERTTAACR
jgi:hypothetical protein